ncbi:MAG: phosphate/phosphite/phosphonate ABC transporter substrate-binding protein [Magnetospirillum sp.]|nr:phosphate/phosphite/phosphonate ABC transporter substrate-binding protein [Magnetospirillum sp.]
MLATAACDGDDAEDYAPTYADRPQSSAQILTFAVHPLHNPETLHAVYQPLIDHLNARLNGPVLELVASRNYAAFEEKLAARRFDFALPNPYQTVTAVGHGYRVFGKMGDDDQFRGIVLVRKDSPLVAVSDLKGKAVSYPAPTALAATMLPQAFFHRHGLDVTRDLDNRYVGSQESSIMNAYLGSVAAAATWPPPWRKFQTDEPAKAAELTVKWETDSLPNNALIARDDVPPAVVEQVASLLFSLHESDEGRALLARLPLSRFEPATDDTYAPVRTFLAWFSANVRRPDLP